MQLQQICIGTSIGCMLHQILLYWRSVSAFLVLTAYFAAIDATAADLHSNIYRVYAAPDIAVLENYRFCSICVHVLKSHQLGCQSVSNAVYATNVGSALSLLHNISVPMQTSKCMHV